MEYARNILITGGAGFIGSHVVRRFVTRYPQYRIVNYDSLTYAGNLANLRDIEDRPNYAFVKADICDLETVRRTLAEYRIDGIIHLAAETHVDRSIKDPFVFARTNVMGTLTLLQAALEYWSAAGPAAGSSDGADPATSQTAGPATDSAPGPAMAGKRFYHVSTDEVYGALALDRPCAGPPYGSEFFTETTPYRPHSPYSAAKASSDHFVRAFHDTYGLPAVLSNCSNNYGPCQFPEKLIPLFINNIRCRRSLPVYGRGENVRDWLYVEDHARAIDLVFHRGRDGQTYNIGGCNEWKNIDLVRLLVRVTDRLLGRAEGEDLDLVTFVGDRAGHDLRYAIDASKIRTELGWEPSLQFEEGLERTVRWYLDHEEWLEQVTSGDYLRYYEDMYKGR